MAYPSHRPRRLRSTPATASTGGADLLGAKAFGVADVRRRRHRRADGRSQSMPGVVQHTRDSLRKAAADAVAAGVGGLMLFGVPREEDKDATGSVGVAEDGILNVALRDLAKDLGDDDRADGRHLPRRVHRPRPLRGAGRRRPRRQRRDQRALRGTGCGAGGFRRARRRPERHDGRSGRRDPRRAGRGRAHRRGDPGVRREVRLGVLRPVPRGGGVQPERGSAHATNRIRAMPARRCTRSSWTSPRAPTS